MKRLYDTILSRHLAEHRQMAFVTGPRQVGKTTSCRHVGDKYFDWDSRPHQRLILEGDAAIAAEAGLEQLATSMPVIIFDELHKYPHWRNFLKGFFDLYEDACRVVVTGSSRLDVYRRGGDSLMGRYFPFRMHPFSIAEIAACEIPEETIIRLPREIGKEAFDALYRYGGFPEPLTSTSDAFSRRWRRLRHDQLFKEDVRDMSRLQELPLVEILGRILEERSSEQLVTSNLARDVGVAPNTVKSWINVLCSLHMGFLVRPWHANISSALRKEPKWFLRDWSGIKDPGQRTETFVACHLLKAVEGWTDLGLGDFELRYIRDKQKREVDFAVIRDGSPWFLVEAKNGKQGLSPSLGHFQKQTGAAHAFQVSMNAPYVDLDCFTREAPVIVPAKTLLSQLL